MIKVLQTPTKAKKIVLGAILVLVAVSMVFYLIPNFLNQGTTTEAGILATVDGHSITVADTESMTERVARARNYPSSIYPMLRGQVANELITQKALEVEAERMGLRVSNAELRDWLQHGPLSQEIFPDGKFIGQDKYNEFVGGQFSMTPEKFEDAVKADLLRQKVVSAVTGSVNVSPSEIEQEA